VAGHIGLELANVALTQRDLHRSLLGVREKSLIRKCSVNPRSSPEITKNRHFRVRVLHGQPRSRVSRSKDVSRERPSARTQLTDAGDESGRNDSPSPELVLVPEGKSGSFRTPINLSVREKLAPSAAGPFPCSGRAWNFCLVQREGRRYRLMQREGKPSPAYPNAGPALLLAGLFLWSLLDDHRGAGRGRRGGAESAKVVNLGNWSDEECSVLTFDVPPNTQPR
jgi:hypothetical protein